MGMPANQAVAVGKLAGSDRLFVVVGIGEQAGMPWIFSHLPQIVLQASYTYPVLSSFVGWLNERSIAWRGQPMWIWGTKELPATLVALDAETGQRHWSYSPPPFGRSA